ncbi:MAG: threonine--tRNA ligase [Candidatus Aenigmarchaeota archaeon]|nr:threonine--tRNA ligase [Candidatus Aenigmarchaeota archaeon]
MKILQLHADWVEYEPVKKEIAQAEAVEQKPYRYENILVVLAAVERGDSEELGVHAIDEIREFMKSLGASRLLVYPYAHLSRELAKPAEALFVIKRMEEHARKLTLDVHRAPFGWTKRFAISVKGHPLAEQSKSFTQEDLKGGKEKKPAKKVQKAPKKEEHKELSPNDHRIVGKKLDLFSFQEEAPGMVFYHPKGLTVRNALIDFWRQEHGKAGYLEVSTPGVMNKSLWETSGHWEHYKNNMFFTTIEDMDFAMKPMNCPGAILVFRSGTRSYRDLPLRLAELGTVHRNELSGVLSGLFRMRIFTQDDAHLFVTSDGLEDELLNVVNLVDRFYKVFGFDYHVELSTRPENSMGSNELWEKAESALKHALESKKMKFKVNEGDGAFYGPKIDFHIKDSLGRTWQCATVQVDFMMPERFSLSYTGSDDKQHRPVIIHRVIYGSLERFLGILVEHYAGAFPLWLSPHQVAVLSMTERNVEYAKKIQAALEQAGFRVASDYGPHTIEYKVREAEVARTPYILVCGDKEEKNNTIAVRKRGMKGVEFGVKPDDFVRQAAAGVTEKKIW